MRGLPLFALLCLPALAGAKIYFVDQGVPYHIGDNRYERSEDNEFVNAYPVVGQEWIQAFKVSESDKVKVHIRQVRGVDDCPYCKVIVSVSDHDMARFYQENNRQPFDTPEPLALKVEPGITYYLKIASYGDEKVDDFVIEGVSVETQSADVIFLRPGPVMKSPQDPMPVFAEPVRAPVVEGDCPGVTLTQAWVLGKGQPRDELALKSAVDFESSGKLGDLKPGQAVEFFFRAEAGGTSADAVGRAVEILSGDKDSGWVLSLDSEGRFRHGNLRVNGNYRSARFREAAFKPAQWNRARLAFCPDGRLRLWINGAELKATVNGGQESRAFSVRSLGLRTELAAAHKF